MGPSTGQVVVLGALQGVAEFLPVSSSGHLALAEILFGIKQGGLALDVMLHGGTLLATLLVLRHRVGQAIAGGARSLVRPSRLGLTAGGRDARTVIVASVPTAIIGLGLHSAVESWTSSPLIIGVGFLSTAALLVSTRWAKVGDDAQPSLAGALIIGVCQGLAVVPGISRSGSTIAAALWLGVRPDRAFELSMLMSLPAVAGAMIVESRHMSGAAGSLVHATLGALVALILGVAALLALRRVTVRGHFSLFALWVLPIAVATLAMAKAWPR